jgi:CHAD domain-containing protein
MGEKSALRPDVAVGRALTAAAWSILEEARAPLRDSTIPDTKIVHDVRKALKRWRALLRLIGPFLDKDGRKLRIRARDLARGLASARDARSALDALADIGEEYQNLSPRSLATVQNRLDNLRVVAEAAILTDKMRAHVATELADISESIAEWSLTSVEFADIADGLSVTYRHAFRMIPEQWATAGTDELHELRKRVVEHRYQMELIEPLWPRLGRVWVSEAQRLRERLGKHHDLAVLARLSETHAPLAPWRARLAPMIRDRQSDHVGAAARLAGRLFAEKPDAFRRRLIRLWNNRARTEKLKS